MDIYPKAPNMLADLEDELVVDVARAKKKVVKIMKEALKTDTFNVRSVVLDQKFLRANQRCAEVF